MTLEDTRIEKLARRCGFTCADALSAEQLQRECFCLAVDPEAVLDQLAALLPRDGAPASLLESHRHLFAALPVFVPGAAIERMTQVVRAIEAAVASPAWWPAVEGWAPAIAAHDPGSPGGLLGFDFHLSPDGPQLIEINTNPGGVLLNALVARAQYLCMPELAMPATEAATAEDRVADAWLAEWRQQSAGRTTGAIAIVDEAPESQYLYPEFVLFRDLFERLGHETLILDPAALVYRDGGLHAGGRRIGFVYNRLTDFALDDPRHAPLRQAFLDGAVAMSPHPRAHARYADKRNLALLGDAAFLRRAGLAEPAIATLLAGVPPTEPLTDGNRDALWARRNRLFFKPAGGYGGKASYRGDKLTRKTWEQMATGDYVAQAIVPPSERPTSEGGALLKVDIRCYAAGGEPLLFAARTYQGQTTNFRTPGGGFAPVLTFL